MNDRNPGRFRELTVMAALATLFSVGITAQNVSYHDGPTMQSPLDVYLIYWLPAGVAFDTSVSDGVGNLQVLTSQFYNDLPASTYLNIATQYPENCGSNKCVLQSGAGGVVISGSWFDSAPYPRGSGTQSNPLLDSDVQNQITSAIVTNNWPVGANSIFVVITGVFVSTLKVVAECQGNGSCGGFCAYHSNFALSNGQMAAYAYLPDASYEGGCNEGISSPVNGQLSTDREIAMMTHEFMESVTDISPPSI